MTKRDFSKARARQSIADRGFEPMDGGDIPFGKPRRYKPKVDDRKEASSLISPSTMITKMIECRCGHKGKARIPIARAGGPFKCVKCGRVKT